MYQEVSCEKIYPCAKDNQHGEGAGEDSKGFVKEKQRSSQKDEEIADHQQQRKGKERRLHASSGRVAE